jgi:hypothetical protein
LQLKVRDRPTTNRATQQHAKAKIESIETSATAGAMTGNAPSKKQPIVEQRSLANILLSTGNFSRFVSMTPPGARGHLAGPVASPAGTAAKANYSQCEQEHLIERVP